MKSFNVFGRIYKHVRTDNLPDGAIALCDADCKIISTHPDLDGDELLLALIHELDHASKFECGLWQTMDRTALEVSAESIARVMLDNFKLSFKKKR